MKDILIKNLWGYLERNLFKLKFIELFFMSKKSCVPAAHHREKERESKAISSVIKNLCVRCVRQLRAKKMTIINCRSLILVQWTNKKKRETLVILWG